ncbi:MAG: YARHG domain-containing protein [Peptostreptococcaceae bacterium]|nr:YARHG domain-containing protein [Peptostreptococcaceae bacterium]
MERNPNFTKEKADFVFNKIQKYFEQNAYRLALSEIISNRELLGSVLNIGSQLKLNKIFSQSVVNLMLDAFEVDGDLSRFNELFSQNQTVLELHTEQKTFELLNKYYNEKDSNPNFKSKNEHYDNKSVPPDDSIFPEEGAVQISIKSASDKLPEAIDIERDFLNSIESPSFHHAPLSEDEMKDDGEVIKSNIDAKAIHADFFDSIRPPNMSSTSILPSDDYEQIAFDDKLLEPDQKEKAERLAKEKIQAEAFEPISIEKTILGKKEDDTVQALRAKIQSIEAKASGKTEEPPEPSHSESIVKERREIVENGEVRTETINKSGGKVTEITLDNYKFSEYHTETEITEEKKSNKKSKKKKKQPDDVEKIKKEIASLKAEEPRKKSGKAQNQKKNQEQRPRRKRKRELNYPFIALIVVVALLLLFGGYKAVSYFSSKAPNTQSEKQPSENKPSDKDKDKENSGNQAGNQTTTPSAENKPKYILPTDEREITDADFEGMTKAQVRLALNEMFARHGWNFGKSGELYDYFSKQSWYKPDMSMTSTAAAERKFNEFEKKNLHILKEKFNSM